MSVSETLPDDFFQESWQRQPVHLPGFAAAVLPEFAGDPSTLRNLVESHSSSRGDGNSVWFLERVRGELPEIARLCADAAEAFEWDDVWCDVFATRGRASIGRHFDDSDNFTIQLAGIKQWRLRPPATIPSNARHLRAIGEPGVGGLPDGTSPDDLIRVLSPGDGLYIPSMWSHEGLSECDSLSVSLVVNVATVLHALLPELLHHMRTSSTWTQLLATGPGSAVRRRRQLEAATGPGSLAEMSSALNAAFSLASTASTSPRREPPPIELDLDWLRGYFATGPEVPTQGLVRFDPESSAAIAALAARRTMKRFAKALVVSSTRTEERRAKLTYAAVAAVLPRLTPYELDRVMTDPDVTSWTANAAAADNLRLSTQSTIDLTVDVLATALLPELAAHYAGAPLLVYPPTDIDGAVTLRRLGIRVTVLDNPLALLVSSGRVDVCGLGPVTDIAEALPSIGGPVLCRAASEWFADRAPIGAGVYAVDATGSDELAGCLRSALDLLTHHYPAAATVFCTNIRAVLPLPSIGHRANNYSLPAFRGLIATSARDPYMIAQAMAHETAHNQVNSLLEVARLCANPATEVVSPVVGVPRPLTALFHGSIAFAQDIQLSRALIAAGHPAGERIERYLSGRVETVAETIDLLRRAAELTSIGGAVIAQVERALDGD